MSHSREAVLRGVEILETGRNFLSGFFFETIVTSIDSSNIQSIFDFRMEE